MGFKLNRKKAAMNFAISKINFNNAQLSFKRDSVSIQEPTKIETRENVIPVYGDDAIRTNPAQLSLFAIHDFHGQNIRMEKAYTASKQFDRGNFSDDNQIFDKNRPIDRLKLSSGDIFLGENLTELAVANEFLNITGILANTIGNHECDSVIEDFTKVVQSRKYRLLGANMHPEKNHLINSIISASFIAETNGNKYGIIGLVPPDLPKHLKRPEDAKGFNIDNLEDTAKDLQKEVNKLKEQGVNKIILLSHTGLANEQYLAQNVSGVDIILGGHTHNLIKDVKENENLFTSPTGEPVLIMQVGRDGEFIGNPNVLFNELGQITKIQYNVVGTDQFGRSIVAKSAFENILGKPDIVGTARYVEEPPKDIYITENPHCNFITDCLREELGTDIAVMNSANIRGRFNAGDIDTRDLALISPFGNKMSVIEASEAELVDRINTMIEKSLQSEFHRPGIFQVSGLRYEYSKSKGKLTSLSFVDKKGNEHKINIDKPREDKFYTIAVDDFCATSPNSGMNLKHRYDTALKKFDVDKDKIVERYLRKNTSPIVIKKDGRIKCVD